MNPIQPDGVSWSLSGLVAPHVAGQFVLRDQDFAIPYRVPCLAIHLYDYTGEVRFPHATFAIQPGDMTFTPPETETRYHLPRAGRHWCLHVHLPNATTAPLRLPLHLRLGQDATMARDRLVRIIDHVRRARSHPDGPATVAAAAALLELLAWLAERGANDAPLGRAGRAVQQAAEELRLRPERQWRVPKLAATVGLSPAHLARCFRQSIGHTLARYQLIHRIGAAQALLACTEETIGRIGARVGLPDPHHFNKLFRRIAGCPPSVFRERHRAGTL